MTYNKLIKQAKRFASAIYLERQFSHSKRSLLKSFSGLLTFISGLLLFGLLAIDLLPAHPEIMAQISPFFAYLPWLWRLTALSALIWLMVTAIHGFHYSYWFIGLTSTQKEHNKHTDRLRYESAEILLGDTSHPTRAFMLSPIGQEILARSGVVAGSLGDMQTSLSPDSVNWSDEQTITISFIARFLSENDEGFMKSLFRAGVQKDDFLGAANWIERKINRQKRDLRRWGRDRLGRIPGIGKEWSYGYTYYLEQHAVPIEATSEYQSASLESHHHEKEARELEAILSRGREANVLLVGKEGVGKLAIVARVAKEIEQGIIFPQLEHKKIYLLDGQGLVTSGSSKNDFEQILRTTLNESAKAGNIILAITDLHAVIQSAQAVGSDLIALMDPYLTTEALQVIGITNEQAYFGLLERMPKIMQRFDTVNINSADRSQTLNIIRDEVDRQESIHRLGFTYPAVAQIVDNTDRYITSGVMPDKAIDILLEMTSLLASQGVSVITEQVVNQFFSEKTNIPIGDVQSEERETLLSLETILHNRVIGQEEAVKAIATTMRRARAGVQNPDRPIGSFLFLGPTGVGKTEVSKTLAEAYFGKEDAMMRFDMSEYKSLDSLDKLIGSFQGGQSGTLVRTLKKQPYGLLLLDEFEKSNDQVKDLFLQILDEGRFSDMNGSSVNARSTIIIATSNAGADYIWEVFQNGKDPNTYKQDLIDKIISSGVYKPELLNRFDGIVVFHPLAHEHLIRISELMLAKLSKRMLESKGIEVSFAPDIIEAVATKGSNPQFGARPMNRFIQEHVEQTIADQILRQGVRSGSSLLLRASDL